MILSFLCFLQAGELVLYSYNLAEGSDDIFQNHIRDSAKRITRWNNARFHLLNSVAHQKMGLFQHVSIHDVPEEKYCAVSNITLFLMPESILYVFLVRDTDCCWFVT